MYLEEFYDYKNLLMKDLCSNAEIVKMVTGKNNPTVPAIDLAYSQIYPFEFRNEFSDTAMRRINLSNCWKLLKPIMLQRL